MSILLRRNFWTRWISKLKSPIPTESSSARNYDLSLRESYIHIHATPDITSINNFIKEYRERGEDRLDWMDNNI